MRLVWETGGNEVGAGEFEMEEILEMLRRPATRFGHKNLRRGV